jgi:preprotein translocase subunit SecA
MRLFNAGMVERVMNTAGLAEDQPIESKMVSRSIQSAQTQVEAQNYEIRKNVLKYDDVLNRQRTVIYDERRRVLEGEDLQEQMRHFVNDVIEGYIDSETAEGYPEDWNLDRLWTALKGLYPISVTPEQLADAAGGRLGSLARACSRRRSSPTPTTPTTPARPRWARRSCVRSSAASCSRSWTASGANTSTRWTTCKEGIGLRAMAQRDPLVEYQREGFLLWQAMNESVREEAVGLLFHVEVQADRCTSPRCSVGSRAAVRRLIQMPRRAPCRTTRRMPWPRRRAVRRRTVSRTRRVPRPPRLPRRSRSQESASAVPAPGPCTTRRRARAVGSRSATRGHRHPRVP